MMNKLNGGLLGLLLLSLAFAAETSSAGASGAAGTIASLILMLMFLIPFMLWLGGISMAILLAIFWIMMIIDLVQTPEKSFKEKNGKMMWLLIVLLIGPLGGVVYYFGVKKKRGGHVGSKRV